MSDKKDYVNVLKALDRTGIVSTAVNQLSDVQAATEDERLRDALEKICNATRRQLVPLDGKGRLLGLPERFAQLSKGMQTLANYCEQMRDSSEPQWQILAKRAGWTPPASQ